MYTIDTTEPVYVKKLFKNIGIWQDVDVQSVTITITAFFKATAIYRVNLADYL